ncbi:MAG TPA: VOC family protein [Kofleriaceae bacterium]|nr:VOC family protein [Kofleriaceae bacterium]
MPKLTYLEIFAKDPAQAARFYEAVCGWKIDQRSADDFRFSDDAASLIGRWTRGDGGDGMISYFTVADVEASVAAAQQLGGAVVRATYHEGNTLIAKLEDPSGNVFGVWHFFDRR